MLPWVVLTGHLSQAASWVSAGNQLQKTLAASCAVTRPPEWLTVFQNLVTSKSVGGQWLRVESGMGNYQTSVCVRARECVCGQRCFQPYFTERKYNTLRSQIWREKCGGMKQIRHKLIFMQSSKHLVKGESRIYKTAIYNRAEMLKCYNREQFYLRVQLKVCLQYLRWHTEKCHVPEAVQTFYRLRKFLQVARSVSLDPLRPERPSSVSCPSSRPPLLAGTRGSLLQQSHRSM